MAHSIVCRICVSKARIQGCIGHPVGLRRMVWVVGKGRICVFEGRTVHWNGVKKDRNYLCRSFRRMGTTVKIYVAVNNVSVGIVGQKAIIFIAAFSARAYVRNGRQAALSRVARGRGGFSTARASFSIISRRNRIRFFLKSCGWIFSKISNIGEVKLSISTFMTWRQPI